MRNTDVDWEKLAQDNAYWAVLTEDGFKGEPSPQMLASFFARGEENVRNFQAEIQRRFPAFAPPFDTVVDFGCGAGRLLLPMARQATSAFGIDISETMRALTTQNAASFGLRNVMCVPTAEELVARGVKADWVSSFIVLQHIEPRRGYFIINDLLQLVKPGGFVSLHVPLFKSADQRQYYNDRMMYFRNDYYRTETVFIDRDNYQSPDIQMYDYDANTIIALFHKNQMTKVELVHDGAGTGIHSYLFIGCRGV